MSDAAESESRLATWVGFLGAGLALLLVLVWVGVIALPRSEAGGKQHEPGNERSACVALRSIAAAQARFQREDPDRDSRADFATLEELSDAEFVDAILGSGTKVGYAFAVAPSATRPEQAWVAVATPSVPGTTGDRFFAIREDGRVVQRGAGPFELDADAPWPSDATEAAH